MNTTESSPSPAVLSVSSGHKRNGKIARLPKVLRDKINQWLDDGRTYPQIIKDLGDDAKDLKPGHFSEWRKGGYQDYLRRQDWRDDLRITRESGSEMDEFSDGPKFQETLVQVALTEIFRVLQQRELKPDSLNFIRLFNALARLNREALGLRKYNDLLAKEQAELKQLDIDRDISKNEHRAIVDRADRIFRMPRPAPDETEMPRPRPLWSAPAERSGDGALVDSSPATALKAFSPDPQSPKLCPSSPSSPSSPLPSRPCHAETPAPAQVTRPTKNRKPKIDKNAPPPEHCLDCGFALPPVPPDARRRPDDHCPSCGMRLPDIGLCYQSGFDKCLNCGATQPHLLPGGERPRPNCHKCGERLHNPEPPAA
jgi:hypothetical protein